MLFTGSKAVSMCPPTYLASISTLHVFSLATSFHCLWISFFSASLWTPAGLPARSWLSLEKRRCVKKSLPGRSKHGSRRRRADRVCDQRWAAGGCRLGLWLSLHEAAVTQDVLLPPWGCSQNKTKQQKAPRPYHLLELAEFTDSSLKVFTDLEPSSACRLVQRSTTYTQGSERHVLSEPWFSISGVSSPACLSLPLNPHHGRLVVNQARCLLSMVISARELHYSTARKGSVPASAHSSPAGSVGDPNAPHKSQTTEGIQQKPGQAVGLRRCEIKRSAAAC